MSRSMIGCSVIVAAVVSAFAADSTVSENISIAQGEERVIHVEEGDRVVYSGVISGQGAIRKTGTGALRLTGANTFSGGLQILTGRVDVVNVQALGTGAVTVRSDKDKTTGTLNFVAGGTYANAIHVTGTAVPYDIAGAYAAYRQIVCAPESNGQIVELTGKITADDDVTFFLTMSASGISQAQFKIDDLDAPNSDVYYAAVGCDVFFNKTNVRNFGGPIVNKALWGAPAGSTLEKSVYHAGGAHFYTANHAWQRFALTYTSVYFHDAGLPDENTILDFARYCNGVANTCLFMCGHDRVANRIYGQKRERTATQNLGGRLWAGANTSVASAAKLTLKGTDSATTGLDVMSKVSLVWEPTGCHTQTFDNSWSETSGTIGVSNGVFRLTGDTLFSNVTAIAVADGAEFLNESTAGRSLWNLKTLSVGADGKFVADGARDLFSADSGRKLYLASTAELYLPADEVLVVDDIYVDGARICGGDYVTGGVRSMPQLKSGKVQALVRPGDFEPVTWTGGAGTDKTSVSEPGNWQGGETPDLTSGLLAVTVTGGAKMTVDQPGVKFSALVFDLPTAGATFAVEGEESVCIASQGLETVAPADNSARTYTIDVPLSLSAPQGWEFDGSNVVVNLNRTISSTDAWRIDRRGFARVNFNATNAFTGVLALSNGVTHVYAPSNAFGVGMADVHVGYDRLGANTRIVLHGTTISQRLFCGTYAADNYGMTDLLEAAENSTNVVRCLTSTSVSAKKSAGFRFGAGSRTTFEDVFAWNAVANLKGPGEILFPAGYFSGAHMYLQNNAHAWFGHYAKLTRTEGEWYQFNLAKDCVAEALDELSFAWSRSKGGGYYVNGLVRLHGHTAIMDRLQGGGEIKTEPDRPTTLYLDKNYTSVESMLVWGTNSVQFTGPITLHHNGETGVHFNHAANKPIASTGELWCSTGTVSFAASVTWPSCAGVTVRHQGKLQLRSGKTFPRTIDWRLADAAKVGLPAGAFQTVHGLFVGSATASLPPGRYSNASVPQGVDPAVKNFFVAGGGGLKVSGGLMVIVR